MPLTVSDICFFVAFLHHEKFVPETFSTFLSALDAETSETHSALLSFQASCRRVSLKSQAGRTFFCNSSDTE